MKSLTLRNKMPVYYAVFIVLALIPQILGFNSSGIADVWKIAVLLWLCLMSVSMTGKISFTNVGIYYLVCFLLVNIFCLLTDSGISVSTLIGFGTSALLIYLFFDWPIKERTIGNDDVLRFFRFFALFMLIACLYNMTVNIRQLLNITSISIYGGDATASFFDNKNTFGVFLIFGAISATFLKVIDGRKRWLLLMAVFILNEVMAMCRTAIVLTLIFLMASFIVGDKETLKKRIFMLAVLLTFAVALYFAAGGLREFIDNNLFGNTDSLDTREGYVLDMLPLAKGIYLFLGYGDARSTQLALEYTGNRYYHNTYLHLLMMGGIMRIVLFALTVLYALVNIRRLCRLSRKTGYMCLATVASYLIYASVESVILFDTPVIAMLATIFVVAMPRLFLNAAEGSAANDNR